jgi:phosphoenolpyruvate phosphomutase
MSVKTANFRAKFFSGEQPLRIVGAHDGLGAQLIERHGFDGVWASGLEISASHGVPDANILTMTQCLERAQEMNTASNLPIIADVDTGYGNSSNVAYMVNQYEAAGIAAVIIEDKLFPKVNSFVPGRQELASIPEFCGKLAAARDARLSEDFLVIARVEALIAGWGQAEALKRAQAYVDAGADAILIHSKSKEASEIREFLTAWKQRSPIVLVPTTYPDLTYEEMSDFGVNMIIYANQGIRACIRAMHDVFDVIDKEKSTVSIEDTIAPVKEIFELQGMFKLKEHEKKFLRTQKTIHAIIPAAGVPNMGADMADLLQNKPVAMLDTEGKPLIQRIAESLNLAGIQDVTVITGYHGDQVVAEGISTRQIDTKEQTGIVYSIEQAADKFTDSVLIHFGDVIVSHENLQSFIACDDPVVVMVSPLSRDDKALDYVSYVNPRHTGRRTLERHPRNQLRKIAKDVAPDERHGEFVGLVLLNPEGVALWRQVAASLGEEQEKSLTLNAFLEKMIAREVPITTFEAQTGWAEVHSRQDYDHLCTIIRYS